jgi:hypothetical protein
MTMRSVLLSMCSLLVGCSEAADSNTSGGSESSMSVATSTAVTSVNTSSSSSGAGGAGGASSSGAGGAPSEVVINEVSGVGADWVELYNPSNEAVSLEGLRLADDAMGAPKLADAMPFPQGSQLAPGEYLFVLADLGSKALAGAQTECAPGPSPCLHAKFGITKTGDVLYLVDAKDAVVTEVAFPSTVMSGDAWGRIPNGTGAFAVTKPTPGAANTAK